MDSTRSVWLFYCPGKLHVFSNLKFIFLGRYFNQEPSSLTIITLQRIFALYSHLESFFLPTLKIQHLCRLESTLRCLNSFKSNFFPLSLQLVHKENSRKYLIDMRHNVSGDKCLYYMCLKNIYHASP